MATVTIEIPQDILDQFGSVEDIRKSMHEDFIVEQRQSGNISLGRAAELLGMTYEEFFDLLGRKGKSLINASPEELEESRRAFEKVMAHFR